MLPSFPALRHVENVVELGIQAKREHHNVQQVVLCDSPLQTGQVRGVASPSDLENGEHMPKALNLTVHRGEVPAEHQ